VEGNKESKVKKRFRNLQKEMIGMGNQGGIEDVDGRQGRTGNCPESRRRLKGPEGPKLTKGKGGRTLKIQVTMSRETEGNEKRGERQDDKRLFKGILP